MNPPVDTLTSRANTASKASTATEATIEEAAEQTASPVIEDELLVEEISIDGMCGVY